MHCLICSVCVCSSVSVLGFEFHSGYTRGQSPALNFLRLDQAPAVIPAGVFYCCRSEFSFGLSLRYFYVEKNFSRAIALPGDRNNPVHNLQSPANPPPRPRWRQFDDQFPSLSSPFSTGQQNHGPAMRLCLLHCCHIPSSLFHYQRGHLPCLLPRRTAAVQIVFACVDLRLSGAVFRVQNTVLLFSRHLFRARAAAKPSAAGFQAAPPARTDVGSFSFHPSYPLVILSGRLLLRSLRFRQMHPVPSAQP